MTVGISAANLATPWLNMLRASAFSAPAGTFVKLHIGDPGATAASNASAVVTRSSATFTASSAGSALALSNTPSWAMTTTETISHISVLDASSAGNFLFSAVLNVAKAVNNGDTLNLTTLGFSLTPQAA